MYAGRDFKPSDTQESEPYCLDFVNDILRDGDTIISATWSIAVAAHSKVDDPDVASRLVGEPYHQNKRTFQRVAGLQPGVVYRLQATVATAQGGADRISLWSFVEGSPQ